ncbi:MAG: hypothetical protein AB1427_12900 [Thermodesulfobacteriota bacterium]
MAIDNSQTDQDWESRVLCSDESCIGVIGPDGRCKECGKKFEGDLSKISFPADEAVPSIDTEPAETELEETAEVPEKQADSQADPDWESRRLCSDESCIGVIGPDGRCKECGKPFSA